MTEQNKTKTVRRPARVALIAAAMVAALGITAAAANSEAIHDLIITVRSAIFVTGSGEEGSFAAIKVPETSVEERDGRTFLLVDEDEVDITDALAQEGAYTYRKDYGDSSVEVAVDAAGMTSFTVFDAEGKALYNFANQPGANGERGTYTITTQGEAGRPVEGEMGTYSVTTDARGAAEVSPAED